MRKNGVCKICLNPYWQHLPKVTLRAHLVRPSIKGPRAMRRNLVPNPKLVFCFALVLPKIPIAVGKHLRKSLTRKEHPQLGELG